jgi:signal transduction histidine kinase
VNPCNPPFPEVGHAAHKGVRITVADNGSGIHPDRLQKIFEAFFTTKQDVGTGLGLWLSQEILRKQAGRISVKSRCPSAEWNRFLYLLARRPGTKRGLSEMRNSARTRILLRGHARGAIPDLKFRSLSMTNTWVLPLCGSGLR